MPAILEADDLHAQYGSTVVLHGLRFAVEAGGITTILGANGAGKTTTLRAVCAMVKTSGEVRFDGQRIDGKTTENIVRLGIAHTPEGRGTFVDLTVEENLRLGAYARRDRSGLEGAYEKVYQHFPVLAERRRQQAGTLSGGEQQMLAVARALMSGPRLLLLDEPSLGLAPLIVREIFRIVRSDQPRGGRERPPRGAERRPRARPGRPGLSARDRPRGDVGPGRRAQEGRRHPALVPRLLGARMDIFVQQVVSGLATGGIYASLALALVMIYQATDVVNFAQGEMAMFSTYLAWTFLQAGMPYWVAFCCTVVVAFVGGLVIERVVIRPVENAPILSIVIVTLGLLVILNSTAGWIYSYIQKPFPSPFPSKPIRIGNIVFGAHDLGAIGVTLVVLALLFAFFRYTTLGLAMRAAAQNPASSRLCGIRVSWMLALGWGLAAAFGAVAGIMVAPVVFLDPNMMVGIQLYAFAAATVGGFTSPLGAVVGGLLVGVTENLVGTYVSFIGTELKLTVALAMIIVVLLVRPSGLFGRTVVRRV